MMERKDGRACNAPRAHRFIPNFVSTAAGSCLIETGRHTGDLHRIGRGGRAAFPARQGLWLADGGIRHAACSTGRSSSATG